MKAILEFNLPEDNQDFNMAVNAMKFWSVLYELDQNLRVKTKYAPDNLPQDKYDAYQEVRELLHQLMNEESVNLEMVK
jgi:D-ribose pyranose/furanose isomerase RbsD